MRKESFDRKNEKYGAYGSNKIERFMWKIN